MSARTDVVSTNPYRVAGEAAAIRVLRDAEAAIEKGADLDRFQLETLLSIIKNQVASLVAAASDPRLPFVYLIMKRIVEDQIKRKQRAIDTDEQGEYAYGFPAMTELQNMPEAFDFKPY